MHEYRTALISAAVTGKIDVRGQTCRASRETYACHGHIGKNFEASIEASLLRDPLSSAPQGTPALADAPTSSIRAATESANPRTTTGPYA